MTGRWNDSVVPARSARRLEALTMRPASADTEVPVMDLSDVAWLDPVHLVGIAAGAHLAPAGAVDCG